MRASRIISSTLLGLGLLFLVAFKNKGLASTIGAVLGGMPTNHGSFAVFGTLCLVAGLMVFVTTQSQEEKFLERIIMQRRARPSHHPNERKIKFSPDDLRNKHVDLLKPTKLILLDNDYISRLSENKRSLTQQVNEKYEGVIGILESVLKEARKGNYQGTPYQMKSRGIIDYVLGTKVKGKIFQDVPFTDSVRTLTTKSYNRYFQDKLQNRPGTQTPTPLHSVLEQQIENPFYLKHADGHLVAAAMFRATYVPQGTTTIVTKDKHIIGMVAHLPKKYRSKIKVVPSLEKNS